MNREEFENKIIQDFDAFKEVELPLVDVAIVISVTFMKLLKSQHLQDETSQKVLNLANVIVTKDLVEYARQFKEENEIGRGGNA